MTTANPRASWARAGVMVLLLSVVAGCAAPAGRPPTVGPLGPTLLLETAAGRVVPIRLEEYVEGAVAAEAGVAWDGTPGGERVLELQAIVSRTYAVANRRRHDAEGFDLCSTTHCQVFGRAPSGSRSAGRAARAAAATRGKVIWFESTPIQALYHQHCGGRTSAADAVWGGTARPYLRSVADDACLAEDRATWTFQAPLDALRRALNEDDRTAVGARLDAIAPLEYDEGGRVALVGLHGERSPVVRGEELRAVLTGRFGARSLRSTRFTVARRGGIVVFTGQGSGHGAGLCQIGAFARLRDGESVEDVIRRYYPGTEIRPWPGGS